MEFIAADRSTVRYRSERPDDAALRARLRELADQRRRFGCRRLHVLLRQKGHIVNRKNTQRPYREEGLTVARQLCDEQARHGAWRPATGPVLRRHVVGFVSAVDIALPLLDPSLSHTNIPAASGARRQSDWNPDLASPRRKSTGADRPLNADLRLVYADWACKSSSARDKAWANFADGTGKVRPRN